MRSNKTNRALVYAWRVELATVPRSEWQRAHYIQQQLVDACKHRTPSGQQSIPRACRFCKHYGHSQRHCLAKREHEEDLLQAELATVASWQPKTVEEKAWKRMLDHYDNLYQAALAAGEQGCALEHGGPCHQCKGCLSWQGFYRDRHAAFVTDP